MPSTIEQVHREYRRHGLTVLAVDIDESRETVAAWTRDHAVTVTILLDPGARTAHRYDVTATPTTFLVDGAGVLVGKAVGTKGWMSPRGRLLLDALTRR